MDSDANFTIVAPDGNELKGEGKASTTDEALVVRSATGLVRSFPYRDMASLDAAAYRLVVRLRDGTALTLSSLGHRYEDLVREVHRARNELILGDLLVKERLRKQGVKGELRPFRGAEGPCEVRLYDTALVVLPAKHQLARVRYSDIEGIEAASYTLRVAVTTGEVLTLGMLGRELDPLWNGISSAMGELEEATQALVKDAFPGADTATLVAASRLLREGRAAGRGEIEDISPQLWAGLERKLGSMGLAAEYAHLTALGRGESARIGVKRSLAGDGEYVWFAVPLLGDPGNAVAVEATSSAVTGRATYFFRVAPRASYPSMGEEGRWEAAERCMDLITRGLREVNFRRQPVYLRDDQMLQPPFSRYRFSVALIPELRALRSAFIGRVAHTSEEEWNARVGELLAFNASARDDGAKWSAGEGPEGPDD